MKRVWTVLLVMMLAVGLMLSGCGGSKEQQPSGGQPADNANQPIKIGFLGAKTGSHAIYGLGTLKGMQMAAEEINNSGGLLGRQVVIVEDDHGSKLEEIATITPKFIERERVVAIVGDPTTGGTKVAAPIANRAQVVLLSAGATGPGVVEIGEYIFRNTLLDTVAAPATIDYVVNTKGWNKIALITSRNNDYSVGLSSIFRQAIIDAGGEIVIEESIQDGDTDFSGVVTNIRARNPEVIVFSGYFTEGALIMNEVRRQGMNDVVMVGGDGLQGDDLMRLGQQSVVGSITYAGFSPEQPTATTEQFIQNFRSKHNENPDLFSAQGYDAVMLIAEAIRKANSADPRDFHKTLAQTKNFDGVSGVTTFRENREPIKSPVYLLIVTENLEFGLLESIPVEIK